MIAQSSTVRNRVGHQENHNRDVRVASLQADPSIQGLEIDQTSLRLHPDDRRAEPALAVPRSKVAGDRYGHLGSPSHQTRQLATKALQQLDLSRITDRISVRIRARREPQPHRSAGLRELRDGDIRKL